MKNIICLIEQELSETNQAVLETYDNESTTIHLFTQIESANLSMGQIINFIDSFLTKESSDLLFITDMIPLYELSNRLYKKIFSHSILLPSSNSTYTLPTSYITFLQDVDSANEDTKLWDLINYFRYLKMQYPLYPSLLELYAKTENLIHLCFQTIQDLNPASKSCFIYWLEEYITTPDSQNSPFSILGYSILLRITSKSQYLDTIIHIIMTPAYTIEQRFYLYHQLKRIYLTNGPFPENKALSDLYQYILEYMTSHFSSLLTPIPKTSRNKNRVLVFTTQFLGIKHAPTKTALERIYTLGKLLKKEVVCINTREQCTLKGFLPYYDVSARTLIKENNGSHLFTHKDFTYRFFQPDVEMPDFNAITNILEQVRLFKPYEIVMIGDHSIIGDLCANIVPTVCIPLAFSSIPNKKNQFVSIGKKLNDFERELLEQQGYCLTQIIESTFTFELTPQKTRLSKKKLGLPTDQFLIVIVGIRLDYEITADFISSIRNTFSQGIHLVFAGYFEKYHTFCSIDPQFKKHSSFLGYQNDILALMDLCDLYINPPRLGGGFSIVEAFYQGVPGITLHTGDVAAAAGPDFCINSLSEISELILKYKNDTAYYQMMSAKAKARCAILLDSKKALEQMLTKMEQNPLFF